jgi:hypothetical protein
MIAAFSERAAFPAVLAERNTELPGFQIIFGKKSSFLRNEGNIRVSLKNGAAAFQHRSGLRETVSGQLFPDIIPQTALQKDNGGFNDSI